MVNRKKAPLSRFLWDPRVHARRQKHTPPPHPLHYYHYAPYVDATKVSGQRPWARMDGGGGGDGGDSGKSAAPQRAVPLGLRSHDSRTRERRPSCLVTHCPGLDCCPRCPRLSPSISTACRADPQCRASKGSKRQRPPPAPLLLLLLQARFPPLPHLGKGDELHACTQRVLDVRARSRAGRTRGWNGPPAVGHFHSLITHYFTHNSPPARIGSQAADS